MIRTLTACMFALGAAACSAPQVSEVPQRRMSVPETMPPMKNFVPHAMARPTDSNAELARDFLELSFSMESGRALPTFTRFEGPITVRVTGRNVPTNLVPDLDRLIGRLRTEAGIDISRTGGADLADITVQSISRRSLQRLVPNAACFVVPNVSNWQEFRSKRRSKDLDWVALKTRERVAIFLPYDVSPQEVRDCLHEEIAQALGPLNDVYRLPNSVFNDDNFHTVLTGFDMMILRATYARELQSGMSRDQVAARLPAVFARINPRGGRGGIAAPIVTPRKWIKAIENALGHGMSREERRRSAQKAVNIAQGYGWTDTRRAFSLFVLARLSLADSGDIALSSFFLAGEYYSANGNTDLQSAHVGMQLAAFSLSMGDADTTIRIVDSHLPTVSKSQNAALLSTFLMIKAEALDLAGRDAEAAKVRHDCYAWAQYGFGADTRVRLSEISALTPRYLREG